MKATRILYILLILQYIILTGCSGMVPIGGIVDWYRPNASFPVPNNYMIADGRTVTDPQSPLINQTLPDLRSKFIRGANTLNEIGSTGGVASHTHGSTLPVITTSQVAEDKHTHTWAMFNRSTNMWKSFSGNTEIVLVDWGDGLDSEGSGIWPLGFDQQYRPNGSGWFYLNTRPQDGIMVHRHEVEYSGEITMENSTNEPPYVMLIKLVRIK